MKSFPMFIRTTGRRVVIVGGGEEAAQKARLIGKTDAKIVLIALEFTAELQTALAEGRALVANGPVSAKTFQGSAITFIATGCPGADAAFHAIAEEAGALINVVDQPELCDAITPSIVDRDPVVVAIGTEGTAPVLGRSIKTRIEAMLPSRIGHLAALAGSLRGAVAQNVPKPKRRAFWSWVFKGSPARLHRTGAEEEAESRITKAIDAGSAPTSSQAGHIAIVEAEPGARDLLTLRAVERLQEADVIVHDQWVEGGVLELARRDAERVEVGSIYTKDHDFILDEARRGRQVVCLSSNPLSNMEAAIASARLSGVQVEIVPCLQAQTCNRTDRPSAAASHHSVKAGVFRAN